MQKVKCQAYVVTGTQCGFICSLTDIWFLKLNDFYSCSTTGMSTWQGGMPSKYFSARLTCGAHIDKSADL